MRIVPRTIFLKLPAGVFYSKYEPVNIGPLCIKGDTIDSSGDFYYKNIANSIKSHNSEDYYEILTSAQNKGKPFEIDLECESRDGYFEDKQLFVVWQASDMLALLEELVKCIRHLNDCVIEEQ